MLTLGRLIEAFVIALKRPATSVGPPMSLINFRVASLAMMRIDSVKKHYAQEERIITCSVL